MKASPIRWIAGSWLLIFFSRATMAWWDRGNRELHQLERALHPGYDAFGRNCIDLVSTAAVRSLMLMVPVGCFCIALALILSSSALLNHRRTEFWMRSFLDALSALPGFLIALAIGVFFSPTRGTFFLGAFFLAVPSLTRFFESQLRHLRHEPYILASVALGASPLHLWLRHYQPELFRMLRAILPFLALRLIVLETTLSFLGLQNTPDQETWGRLLYQGKDYLLEAPWILGWTATPLAMTLMSFHLLSREEPQ